MASDRMFRVIVLGGIALVGSSACSSAVTADAGDAGTGPESFPGELPVFVEAGPLPDARDAAADTMDSSTDAVNSDASADVPAQPDGFPVELPVQPDSGPNVDAGGADTGTSEAGVVDGGSGSSDGSSADVQDGCVFPVETAFVPDC